MVFSPHGRIILLHICYNLDKRKYPNGKRQIIDTLFGKMQNSRQYYRENEDCIPT